MTAIHIGRFVISVEVPATAKARPSLWHRLTAWLQHRRTLAELQELEPRLRRDVGCPPQQAPHDRFAVDPRPLWGIGLVPGPRDDRH